MSYATTPTSSLDAPQDSVRLVAVMAAQAGCPGAVGGTVSPGTPTVSASTLGPPSAVVAVARILLVPAGSPTVKVTVCHVSHPPVPGNASAPRTRVPFTEMSIARFTAVPLAYRIATLTLPAVAAGIDHST